MARTSKTPAVRTHAFDTETWVTRKGVIAKNTVRVAKGQPGAGTFQGATNLRGTVGVVVGVSLVKSA